MRCDTQHACICNAALPAAARHEDMASDIMLKCMLSGKDVPWTAQSQLPGHAQASGQTWKPNHHLQDMLLQQVDFFARDPLDLTCSRELNWQVCPRFSHCFPVRASCLYCKRASHLGVFQ